MSHHRNFKLFFMLITAAFLISAPAFPVMAREKRVVHRTTHTVKRTSRGRIHRHDSRHKHHYSFRRGHFFRVSAVGRVAIAAPFGAIVVGLPIGYRSIACGNDHYFMYDGIFYRRHTNGYVVVRAPRVRFVPYGARRVLINDEVYFEHGGTWYCHRNGEYELCDSPVSIMADEPEEVKTTTIMIENSNGSRTPVELEPMGANQWKGPRGEIYDGLPTNEQLKEGYGF